MKLLILFFMIALLASKLVADDFFVENENDLTFENRLEFFVQKELGTRENPTTKELIHLSNVLWEKSQRPEFSQHLEIQSDESLNVFLEQLYNNAFSHNVERLLGIDEFPLQNINIISTAVYLKTTAFSFVSELDERNVFYEYTQTRVKDANLVTEDILHAHVLGVFAGTGRPVIDPKQGDWMLFYSSPNPIYRLVALRNILKSWNDDYNSDNSEAENEYLKALVGRKYYLEKMLNDPIQFISMKAHEELKNTDSEIENFENVTGFLVKDIKINYRSYVDQTKVLRADRYQKEVDSQNYEHKQVFGDESIKNLKQDVRGGKTNKDNYLRVAVAAFFVIFFVCFFKFKQWK